MNITNDEIEEMRKDIVTLIRDLVVEVSSENDSAIAARSGFLIALADEEQILLQASMDLNKLKMDNFGIFRTVTDDDFQHTPLGKRLLDLCHMIGEFTSKSSKS